MYVGTRTLAQCVTFALVALAGACGPTQVNCEGGAYYSDVTRGCVGIGRYREENDGAYPDGYMFGDSGQMDSAVADAVEEACLAPSATCEGVCRNLSSDPSHCGQCGRSCENPRNGTAICVMGGCELSCLSGYRRVGVACELLAPRPVYPWNYSTVSSFRPELRWNFAEPNQRARVELCEDRACARVLQTSEVDGDRLVVGALAGAKVHYWRVWSLVGGQVSAQSSATWQFRTSHVDLNRPLAQGLELDVNGDGFSDVAVAAPSAQGGRGEVSVFLGGRSGLASTPSVVLVGRMGPERFGSSLAAVGDVNGDGFGDLGVGASDASVGGAGSVGRVSLFWGSSSGLSSVPGVVVEGTNISEGWRGAIRAAGDTDGDGFSDIVIPTRMSGGSVLVVPGSSQGLDMRRSREILRGDGRLTLFGRSVEGADFNGDGFSDLAIGSDGGPSVEGAVSVFLGGNTGISTRSAFVLYGENSGDDFGRAISAQGDVNLDGRADLLVGAAAADPMGMATAGKVYLFASSGADLARIPTRSWMGLSAGDQFGLSVALVSDVNGDGADDVVIGAPTASPAGRMNAGAVSLFLSVSGTSSIPSQAFSGERAGDEFGTAVLGGGHVSEASLGAIVGTAPFATGGAVLVWSGSAATSGDLPTWLLRGAGGGFASSVACR